MAEAAIITWTPANIITINLMVLLVFFLVVASMKVYQQRKATMAAAA